jgi:hypothetical protein
MCRISCPTQHPAHARPKTMNDLERIQKHHGGPHNTGDQYNRPYWKRAHKSPFFWVAAVFILVAMVIFITTDGFAIRPTPVATAIH